MENRFTVLGSFSISEVLLGCPARVVTQPGSSRHHPKQNVVIIDQPALLLGCEFLEQRAHLGGILPAPGICQRQYLLLRRLVAGNRAL